MTHYELTDGGVKLGMSTFRGGQDNPHKKPKILIGESNKELPALSFPCFESRHSECFEAIELFGDEKCQCKCHSDKRVSYVE